MPTYGFREGDARRIARAVRRVERNDGPIRLGGPRDVGPGPGVRIMLGTHGSAAWDKQSQETITIYTGFPGTNAVPTASAYTVVANNVFADIPSQTANTARWVAVSNNGWGWYVLAAECS